MSTILTSFSISPRDTNTIEENAVALVSLLNSCLLHDLKPTSKDQDPPHAKIASEVVSCIFLVSFGYHNIMNWLFQNRVLLGFDFKFKHLF